MVHEVNEAGIHERNGNMLFPLLVMDKSMSKTGPVVFYDISNAIM